MLRKLLLGVGLVLELAGVILALMIMTAIEYLLSGDWPPLGWESGVPFLAQMSPNEFFGPVSEREENKA